LIFGNQFCEVRSEKLTQTRRFFSDLCLSRNRLWRKFDSFTFNNQKITETIEPRNVSDLIINQLKKTHKLYLLLPVDGPQIRVIHL
jgi:hypothetical protein